MKQMKRMACVLLAVCMATVVAAQTGYYTRECTDKKVKKEAARWQKRGDWRCGFTKASPHSSVNLPEFYSQYRQNRSQWEAMFKWLAETDLLSIPAGKHPIAGSQLVASVEDSHNDPLEKRRSESHYHHIDFQLVVKGTERFGIIDHLTSKPNCEYRPDVIHYDYDVQQARFYDSTPDEFFIFFPDDWHIAKVNNDGTDQTIRVIVVKLDYVGDEGENDTEKPIVKK